MSSQGYPLREKKKSPQPVPAHGHNWEHLTRQRDADE